MSTTRRYGLLLVETEKGSAGKRWLVGWSRPKSYNPNTGQYEQVKLHVTGHGEPLTWATEAGAQKVAAELNRRDRGWPTAAGHWSRFEVVPNPPATA